jgi:hypothetical protein
LINGLIVIYYRQQTCAFSEIQDIHDTLICPPKTDEQSKWLLNIEINVCLIDEADSKGKQKTKRSRKDTTRKRVAVQDATFLTNLNQLLSRRHFLMMDDLDAVNESGRKGSKKRYSNSSSTSEAYHRLIMNNF